MNIYFSFITFSEVIPFLAVSSVFLWVGVLVAGLRYLKGREVKWRATIEPLCTWEYPEAEWLDYAKRYDLAKLPKGNATVKITPVDIWINDAGRVRRNELDADRKCVIACSIANGLFKIRVSSWAMSRYAVNPTYTVLDLALPIPPDKEIDAAKALDYFKNHMMKYPEKIAWCTG